MNSALRSEHRLQLVPPTVRAGLSRFGWVLVCAWLCTAWPSASRAGDPLQLGSEHIGMTAESIADGSVETPAVDPAGDAVQAQSREETEWSTAGSSEDPWTAVADPRSETPVAASYEECIEVAVKTGNGFSAASGICQALFPEPAENQPPQPPAPPEAPSDVTEALEASAAAGTEASDTSEEPLVLRLHGTPDSGTAEADAPEAPVPAEPEAGAEAPDTPAVDE